jgi:hypothetical protein
MPRRILAFALILGLALAAPCQAAITFVVGVSSGSPDTFTHTSGNVDTTGADTIVCYVAELESQGDTTFSDSKGNSWHAGAITERKDVATASLLGRMYYCNSCTVGSGHNFTVTDTSGGAKGALACAAFAGGHSSPLDQQNGNVDIDAGAANTTGGITPSENNTVTVTGLGYTPNAATITINTGEAGWTIAAGTDASANHDGVSIAYKIQTTATATDPTWGYSTAEYAVTSIASFKQAGGGGVVGTTRRGMLLGVGP